MQPATPTKPSEIPNLAALRRWALIVLVGGVGGLGLFGIALTLFAFDTDLIYRVSGTLGVLAAASLLTLTMGALTERRRIDLWYLWVIVTGSVAFSVLSLISIWLSSFWDRWDAIVSSLAFAGATILATPSAIALRANRARWLCIAGLVVTCACFLWTLGDIWLHFSSNLVWSHSMIRNITPALWVLAIISTHTGLVLLIDASRSPALLRWATLLAGAFTGIGIAVLILFDWYDDELLIRLTVASAILATCLTIVTIVVSRIRASHCNTTAGAAIPIDLTCPSCRSNQTLHTGKSVCSQCACAFTIEITPLRCLKCDYALAGLKVRTCPECGTSY